MVPGHEIVGRVTAVGKDVKKFAEGDLAGVGVMVDSCRVCANCIAHEEAYCEKPFVGTYNAKNYDGSIAQGGYANNIVVDERYVHTLAGSLEPKLAAVAPLLCAGITTYSPLKHWKAGPGKKVGIVGLGGLGHMGLKFAHSFGAETVLFTTSAARKPTPSGSARMPSCSRRTPTRWPRRRASSTSSWTASPPRTT